MSFSIKKTHKYANPSSLGDEKSNLSLDEQQVDENGEYNVPKNSRAVSGQTPAKPKKGGQHIRQLFGAQPDFY